MKLLIRGAAVVLMLLVLVGAGSQAQANPVIPVPVLPDVSLPDVPGLSDCKEAPTPSSPGQGISGFFAGTPDHLPPEGDPFAKGANTTIYEQYGYAGLRWRTYDLGCGPDAMRNPDAVIGSSVSNWIMQAPIALAALTGSLTQVAFHPTFLKPFDPVIERVSTALHENLFASWIPAVLAVLGGFIILRARRSALATTAGAIGWALIVVILATALFRWPIAAGNAADATVAGSLGVVVGKLDGQSGISDPGTAVASHIHASILYRAWLAGTLGSPDSATAKKYGASLFKAQALTWRESLEAQKGPEQAKQIIEAKQKAWVAIADQIEEEDPEAYENLTGARSETRVGYAALSAIGTYLALPFLLLAALLMLGCFLIVRLAVMMFPVFATLGAFPASRGLVTGLGRTVAAAVVNAIIFGIGAGVTIAVLGVLFHPGNGAPGWLSLVLMPLFSLIMWQALRPFRRLRTMVRPDADHFGSGNDAMSGAGRRGGHWAKQLVVAGIGAASGGAAGAAVATAMTDDKTQAPPERAEATPTPPAAPAAPRVLGAGSSATTRSNISTVATSYAGSEPSSTESDASHEERRSEATVRVVEPHESADPGFTPTPPGAVPLPPTEPEWYDGEEVYPIYRPTSPTDRAADEDAHR